MKKRIFLPPAFFLLAAGLLIAAAGGMLYRIIYSVQHDLFDPGMWKNHFFGQLLGEVGLDLVCIVGIAAFSLLAAYCWGAWCRPVIITEEYIKRGLIKPHVIRWEELSYLGVASAYGLKTHFQAPIEKSPWHRKKNAIVFIKGDYSENELSRAWLQDIWTGKIMRWYFPRVAAEVDRQQKQETSHQPQSSKPWYELHAIPEEIIWVRYSAQLYGELIRLYEEKRGRPPVNDGAERK